MSAPLLLTARLREGAKVDIHPLAQSKASRGYPALSQVQEARTVRLCESTVNASTQSSRAEKGKRRDWLPLLLREALGIPSVINHETTN